MGKFIDLLKEIRESPRKMQVKYLESRGLLTKINELVPNDFKIKEKIDIILLNVYTKCICGNLTKPNIRWCSITCMNKDPQMRKNTSIKNTLNSLSRLKKAEETRIEKYGVSSVQDIPLSKIKTKISKQKYYDDVIKDTFIRYKLDQTKLSDPVYLKSICEKSSMFEVMREHFNNIPYTTLINHFKRINFEPNFRNGSSSFGEMELYTWLSNTIPDKILKNHRKTLGKELDIFIPSKKLAIEFNGVYWHSETWFDNKGIDAKNYHKEKTELCMKNNIELLHFFEDEWMYKREIIKSMILSKLGIYSIKYFARKLKVEKVDQKIANLFLQHNHIQGKCVGKHIGLFENDNLICIMTYGKSRFDSSYEMIRYASKLNTQVIGGISRLLHYVKKDLETDKITTYADLRFSIGKSYSKLGKYISNTGVGYCWVKKNIRLNRFKTQKHKLEKLFNEKLDLTKTEKQIMTEHGYLKLYDCGNMKFIL